MIINPNTIDILNILINDSNICDISKYLYNNMIDYVKSNNLFFSEYYNKDCNIDKLKYLSNKIKTLENRIKELTSTAPFVKINYSTKKIIYMFSIIEIYLMEDIPDIFYNNFKQNEINIGDIDFENINIEKLDILFEQVYLKYNLVKKIYEESNLEGLIRFELINKKLLKLGYKNLFDLYLFNQLDLDYIVTITSNEADICKYKSQFLTEFILKKVKKLEITDKEKNTK